MAGQEPDGNNSLLGEFLLALARAPENIQEDLIMYGLKRFEPMAGKLIAPYPMLSHLKEILSKRSDESRE